jgi:hypothetical protein
MADLDGIFQIKNFNDFGDIGRIGIHIGPVKRTFDDALEAPTAGGCGAVTAGVPWNYAATRSPPGAVHTNPARQAFIPEMVDKEYLRSA